MIVAVVGILGWSFYTPLKLHYTETREQHRLEGELAQLRERNATLKEQVERLKTPEGVEDIARSSLGLVKEGENLYVVIDPDEATATVCPPTDGDGALEGTLWESVLDIVFGVR